MLCNKPVRVLIHRHPAPIYIVLTDPIISHRQISSSLFQSDLTLLQKEVERLRARHELSETGGGRLSV